MLCSLTQSYFRWAPDDLDGYLNFYSISGDGRVINWTMVKCDMKLTEKLCIKYEKRLHNIPPFIISQGLQGSFLCPGISFVLTMICPQQMEEPAWRSSPTMTWNTWWGRRRGMSTCAPLNTPASFSGATRPTTPWSTVSSGAPSSRMSLSPAPRSLLSKFGAKLTGELRMSVVI